MRRLHFSFYQKYATRISVCVISVSKSQDFLLKVRRLSEFFSTTTPTASRRRVVILSTTTQGIRLRRRVDVFSTTSDTPVAEIWPFSIFQYGGRPQSWICYTPVWTTFEEYLVVFINTQYFVGIGAVVSIICRF